MVFPPSKLKMFTGRVCVLLTSVSLKLIKIKIKLIYATTSSWEKKQNGGWKVSDTDWFNFSFYDPSWSEIQFILFLFFLVDPSQSELIRPGLAVRVDPVWLLHLPSCSFVQCRKYHTMKCCRRASHLGRFTLWNNGRRATQLGRFTLWHYGRLATKNKFSKCLEQDMGWGQPYCESNVLAAGPCIAEMMRY